MKGNRRPRSANVTIDDNNSANHVSARTSKNATGCKDIPRQGEVSPQSGPADAVSTLQKQVAGLSKQLEEVTRSRDELQRDVESLCMQQSSSIFDSSMVLSERLFSAERDLTKSNSQLTAMTEERNNLREDLRGHRDAKASVENSWKAERSRAEKLDKELQFYQAQSARAMSDRDQAAWEAEELRRKNQRMTERIDKTTSRLETVLAEHSDLTTQLSDAEQKIQALEVKARDCEKIPSFLRRLDESSAQIETLKSLRDELEASIKVERAKAQDTDNKLREASESKRGLETDFEDMQTRADAEKQESAAQIQSLEGRLGELEAANLALDVRTEEAEGRLAACQAESEKAIGERDVQLESMRASHSQQLATTEATLTAKLDRLEKAFNETTAKLDSKSTQLEQVTAEKVQALMRVSQAEQTAEQAFEETGNLLAEIADLKEKLAQATQEKVTALLQVASLKEQVRTAGKPSPTQQAKSAGWRIWGGSTPAADTQECTGPEKAAVSKSFGSPKVDQDSTGNS